MKKLILMFLLLPCFLAYAKQKYVEIRYMYTLRDTMSNGRPGESINYLMIREYQGRDAGESPFEICLVTFSEHTGSDGAKRIVNLDELDKAQNFLNSTSDVGRLINVKRPLRYSLKMNFFLLLAEQPMIRIGKLTLTR